MKRKIIPWLLAGTLTLGGCALYTQNQKEYLEVKTTPIEKQIIDSQENLREQDWQDGEREEIEKFEGNWQEDIQKEIRKLDNWAKEYTQSDYTTNTTNREASLKIQLVKELGEVGFMASYDPKKREIVLPQSDIQEERKITLDSIPHELYHVIHNDPDPYEGLFPYTGLTLEEITEHILKKTSDKSFDRVRKRLAIMEELQTAELIINFDIDNYSRKGRKSQVITQEIAECLVNNKDLEENIGLDDYNRIDFENTTLLGELTKFEAMTREISKNISNKLSEFKAPTWADLDKNIELNDVISFKHYVSEFAAKLSEYNNLFTKIQELKEYTFEKHNEAVTKKMLYREINAEEREKKLFENNLNIQLKTESEIQNINNSCEFSKSDVFIDRNMEGYEDRLKGIHKFTHLLSDPDEMMARFVSSLYSLHFGEVTESKFPFDENDLTFLSRFRIIREGREELLFRKGIEKYRVGMEMIKEGYSPAEVRSELEYATEFAYKNKQYYWPENDFTIKGEIPKALKN